MKKKEKIQHAVWLQELDTLVKKERMTHSLKCYPTFFACARTIFFLRLFT